LTENTCFSCDLSHQIFTNIPAPNTIAGQDVDILTHLFLNAPLPNLPQPCHLFQNEDLNKPRAGVSHQQLVDHYHTVAEAIETGFSANVILSPSAWVRTTSDIISHILQGVLTSRNLSPDGKPLDHDEFKGLLNEEDWEAVGCNLTNLNHLVQIFPPPLDCGEPPLICTHCYTHMNLEASDWLMMMDYSSVLMASDRSRSVVIGHFMKILSREIEKDIQQWCLEETSKRKNAIRARIMEDIEAYYMQQWNKKTQVQDWIIEVNCQEYYGK
jgi:hypothetical protein